MLALLIFPIQTSRKLLNVNTNTNFFILCYRWVSVQHPQVYRNPSTLSADCHSNVCIQYTLAPTLIIREHTRAASSSSSFQTDNANMGYWHTCGCCCCCCCWLLGAGHSRSTIPRTVRETGRGAARAWVYALAPWSATLTIRGKCTTPWQVLMMRFRSFKNLRDSLMDCCRRGIFCWGLLEKHRFNNG